MAARGASTSKPYGGGQGSLAAHDFFDGRLPTPPNLPPSHSASGHVSSSRAGPPSPAHSHRLSPSIAHASAAASADRGQAPQQQPTRSLWVGNLSSSTTGQKLTQAFAQYGAIESMRLLPDKECGFVNFVEVADAIQARDDILNRLGGRVRGLCAESSTPIKIGYGKIDESSPNLKARAQSPQGLGTGERDDAPPTRALWVGSIPSSTSPAALLSIFQPFGPVESARILTHKNCGFVNFERIDDAVRARKLLNGHDILGPEVGAVRVGFAKVPSKLEDGSYPGEPNSEGYSIATDQLNNLKGSNGVPVEQQMKPGNLESYRSHFVTEMLHESTVDAHLNVVSQFRSPATYYTSIPVVSESNASRRFDTAKLRDMRKFIEQGQCHQVDIDNLALSLLDSIVDLASDYIGNTLVQKFFERCSEPIKTRMLELVAPSLATVGIHKNGTWAAQKILDMAQSPEQRSLIAHHLRPFIPPLLLDQFGNYVVQCLLPYGAEPEAGDELRSRSDFIFDAMVDRCWEIAQGRFGARSMRACLESPLATNLQKKRVAMAVVLNSVPLATSPNGSLLLNWLLDASNLPGRYRLLSPRFTPHLAHLCTHKLASLTVLRIVNQRLESEAAHSLLDAL
ncbi:ARM repeat-containing protein, partial [Jaminaea rosea]